MPNNHNVEGDLGFVREVVSHSRPSVPASIYLLWGVLVLIGFSLPDFAPEHVGTFWIVVGPAGWLISAFLGWRYARQVGQCDMQDGIRHLAHWGAMLVAAFLTVVLVKHGYLSPEGIGPTIILIVALAYVLAGIHLDRRFLAPGLLMGIGFGILMFVESYSWTIVGVMVAIGLFCSALFGRQRHGAETTT